MVLRGAGSVETTLRMSDFVAKGFQFHPFEFAHREPLSRFDVCCPCSRTSQRCSIQTSVYVTCIRVKEVFYVRTNLLPGLADFLGYFRLKPVPQSCLLS